MKSLREQIRFFRQFTQNLRDVGALFPGSRALARALAAPVLPTADRLRVLEVGAGPGNVTEEILVKLRPQDTLWISELNPEFCEVLRKKFLREDGPKIEIIEGPLQDLKTDWAFDYIVSSLPLNAFGPELVQDLWHCLRSLAKPGGVLAFYEYWGVRRLRYLWPGVGERRRLESVEKLFEWMIKPAIAETVFVAGNLPPAVVHRVQF